ncbi:Bifunctional protein MdtA [Symmachiella macrocystis]|uniref:Bifunctional protein MdtA n=1 Tax=Symmachiella macrocystis TaxID=2527985 RepID=A0A5C6BBQ6_9PLAN|nr:NADP-dependent methylenetetrahydromethanopterin/methylenetetrahydrofolate dehydrogenase [Symmachiella macrocystis]TWU09418.1 Bifunctional protein MdtA [Symmachiella macrocystis]
MKRILIQLDTDPQPSTFDRVVAVDSDVDELFSYGGITIENAEPLVHGAMFTRGPKDLKSTAIFVGGSDVSAGESVLAQVQKTFFGPVRVSVMMDSNGSNTTAAAAVLCAQRHLDPAGCEAMVLGGTGPVGLRAAQILAGLGANVRLASRSVERAEQACATIRAQVEDAQLKPVATGNDAEIMAACSGAGLIIAAGAAGVQFLSAEQRSSLEALKVAIDLNAVPPVGLEGVDMMDTGKEVDGVICYGAIGVGGLKMRIHKAAVRRLFESNAQVLDTAAIYEIGREIGQ